MAASMPRLGGDVARRLPLFLTDAVIVLGILAVAGLTLSFLDGTDLAIGNWPNQLQIDRISHLW